MKKIHVCLVSGQPIPTLIPLLRPDTRPNCVVLLISDDMQVEAKRLENIIRPRGIDVVCRKGIDPYSLESTKEVCLDLITQYENDELTLNTTGGTKLMSLAAFEVFKEMEKRAIYVDTQNRTIHVLIPEYEKVKFQGILKVREYLSAYGQSVYEDRTDRETVASHRTLTTHLVSNVTEYGDAIGLLNKYAAPLRGRKHFPVEVECEGYDMKRPNFKTLLKSFEQEGILTRRGNKLTFNNLLDVDFASGGWLEEHVFSIVTHLTPTDVRMGIKVKWDRTGAKPPTNEYDVILTYNNQLYLIECKTNRFEGEDKKATSAEPIYKLDSLKDAAGGLYGRGMIVSYKKLTDPQKERLKANKLFYCDGPSLKTLEEKIKQWIIK